MDMPMQVLRWLCQVLICQTCVNRIPRTWLGVLAKPNFDRDIVQYKAIVNVVAWLLNISKQTPTEEVLVYISVGI